MFNFQNDYSEGAHPTILERLVSTNMQQQLGYGNDVYSQQAKEMIRKQLDNPKAAVYFVTGGTQANLLVISSLLRSHEAVISADIGHIHVHETGAIEATGHRIITVPSVNGKIRAADLDQVMDSHLMRPHVVRPRLVYISNSTEIGTIYSRAELEVLYAKCQEHELLLFMDGARLGPALTAEGNDLSFQDLSRFTDVFYIGATKNGGLLGEAIVFNSPLLCPDFDYALKQKGALLSKGRLLGVQFLVLFEDLLFFDLAKHANRQAARLKDAFRQAEYSFLTESPTNQLFPVLPNELIVNLKGEFLFYEWKAMGEGHTAIRLITSWATEDQAVDALIGKIQ